MTERRFVPFDPHEPRPPRVPEIKPGALVAAFDENAARVTPWAPMRPDGAVTWTTTASTSTVASVVIWDGAQAWASLPLLRPVKIPDGTLTLILPGASPTHQQHFRRWLW